MFTKSLQVINVNDLSRRSHIVPVFRDVSGYFRIGWCGLDFDLKLHFSLIVITVFICIKSNFSLGSTDL